MAQPKHTKLWLTLDSQGGAEFEQVTRQGIIAQYGVRHRDLRLLDFNNPTPPPSTLFIREKALVLSLEAIRLVITKGKVFILSVPDRPDSLATPVAPAPDNAFVADLCFHLSAGDGVGLAELHGAADRKLPYELRALEGGLAAFTRAFEAEAARLEKRLLPAIDAMTYTVSPAVLTSLRESRRSLKRMVKRLLPLRNALDDILDDDDELRDMYLARMEGFRATLSAADSSSNLAQEPKGPNGLSRPESSKKLPVVYSGPEHNPAAEAEDPLDITQHLGFLEVPAPLLGPEQSPNRKKGEAAERGAEDPKKAKKRKVSRGFRRKAARCAELYDIGDCEDLLEAYITQINHLLVRLTNLEDDIRGSEAQLMVELDQRRNELVATTLFLTFWAATFTFTAMVASLFGMNLNSTIQDSIVGFWGVTGICIFLSAVAFALFVWIMRRKRLLFVGRPSRKLLLK